MVAQAKKDKSHQLWSISPSSPSCIFVKPMDLDLRVAVIIQREALPKKRPTLLRRLPFELSKKKESLEQPPILKKLSDLKWKCDDERFLKTALFECLSLSLSSSPSPQSIGLPALMMMPILYVLKKPLLQRWGGEKNTCYPHFFERMGR